MNQSDSPASTRRIAWLVGLCLAFAAAHAVFLWRGPAGKDGLLYADLALLDVHRPELSWRYLHVALLAVSGQLFGDLAVGTGAYSLLVYTLAIALLAILAWQGSAGVALLTVALGATCPLLMEAATVPYCDLPAVACSAAALVAAEMSVRKRSLRLALAAGGLMVIALRSKETAICIAPALAWVAFGGLPKADKRLTFGFVGGCLLGMLATMFADQLAVGDALWAFRPSAIGSYLAFNTKLQDRGFSGGTLVDHLGQRWLFPYAFVCLAGVVSATKHPRWGALAIWASTAALFHGWSIAVSDFGANERYVLPILFPLFPLGGVWLREVLRISRERAPSEMRRSLACLAAITCLAALGQYLAPHFLRKATHQLLPVAWALLVAWSLSGRLWRPLQRLALVSLCVWTALSSLYSARQMALHVAGTGAENRRLVAVLRGHAAGPIGVLAPSDPSIEMAVRVYSNSPAWSFARVRPDGTWPPTILAEMKESGRAEARGWKQIATFNQLAYGPLGLFVQRAEPAVGSRPEDDLPRSTR